VPTSETMDVTITSAAWEMQQGGDGAMNLRVTGTFGRHVNWVRLKAIRFFYSGGPSQATFMRDLDVTATAPAWATVEGNSFNVLVAEGYTSNIAGAWNVFAGSWTTTPTGGIADPTQGPDGLVARMDFSEEGFNAALASLPIGVRLDAGTGILYGTHIEIGSNLSATAVNDRIVLTAASGGGGGGAVVLDDLTDVIISSPAVRHALMYSGTSWVNRLLQAADLPTHIHDMADITAGNLSAARITAGAFGTGAFTFNGQLTAIAHGGAINLRGTAAGAAAAPYVRFADSNNTRLGYFGFASENNNDIYLDAEPSGATIHISTQNVDRLLATASGGSLYGAWLVSGNFTTSGKYYQDSSWPVPNYVLSTSNPSGSAPDGTLWLKYT
jgi:hypothetical protein